MQNANERERIEREIESRRRELHVALRDLSLSFVAALNLPARIRRNPLPWAIGAAGVATVLVLRARSKRQQQRGFWA